jgi:toluene monooxygenase system protein D
MAEVDQRFHRSVGPVLTTGLCADAIVTAIQEENADVSVQNHAGYLRVLVPQRCRVTAAAIERALGRPFLLPRDLESVMPSFKGRMRVDQLSATWEAGAR